MLEAAKLLFFSYSLKRLHVHWFFNHTKSIDYTLTLSGTVFGEHTKELF